MIMSFYDAFIGDNKDIQGYKYIQSFTYHKLAFDFCWGKFK